MSYLSFFNFEIAFWLNGGVQIFFFISGYLYSMKKEMYDMNWFQKQLKKIVMPYLILLLIVLIADFICFNKTYSIKVLLQNILCLQGFTYCIDELTHTWFISYILLSYLITPFLSEFDFNGISELKFLIKISFLSVFLLLLEVLGIVNIHIPYLLCYIWGFFFYSYYKENDYKFNKLIIILLILFCLTLPIRLNVQYNLFDFFNLELFRNYSYITISINHNFLFILLFLILLSLFDYIKINSNNFLIFFDRYSYYIYLTHQIFILNDFSLLNLTDSFSSYFFNFIKKNNEYCFKNRYF